ncbi:bifunctional phosphoribosylaminoimidazolecarboxamide formyltransferase/IMP cyclohydrolase, partial [bacterium]|nr:bifunctional phosphoribosylaminoimidazolecarboxamide formyltransferase/IMP cyclohydrolase [bacterium]
MIGEIMTQENKTYEFTNAQELKYGENPYQKASLYSYSKEVDYEILQGSTPTYNGIIDASLALEIAKEFFDVACSIITKHENPCAVALAPNLENAYDKAIDADSLSPFGATIAFTRQVEFELAQKISQIPFKTIIAPSYDDKALEKLKSNSALTIIKINTDY